VQRVDALIQPFTRARFVADHWGKRPALITGDRRRLEGVFSRDRFFRAIARGKRAPRKAGFSVDRFVQDFDGAWTCSQALEGEDVETLISEGHTVCVRGIVAGDPVLRRFGESFKRGLGLVGNIGFNGYYSGDGSGADTHFDRSVTTSLQIEGRKRWRFGKTTTLAWPPGNARMQADGTPTWALPWLGGRGWDALPRVPVDYDEVVLEAGDVLCLPAGTWHSAKAEGHSLALNMIYSPLPAAIVLQRLMLALFEASPAWRGGLPAVADMPRFAAGGISADVLSYLQARLDELGRLAASEGPAREEAAASWRSLLSLDEAQ
jgi:ribosomal protein L16 Arg81 hydroxylase